MPFTPYHFGPNSFVGLLLRRWVDVPVIVLVNVIVDVEVLFAQGWYPHRHWHFHTLLVGTIVGGIFGLIAYWIKPLRHLFEWAMRLMRIPYKAGLWKMIISGVLGTWLHVLIDSVYHHDVQPFWPNKTNPLWQLITRQHIETVQVRIKVICLIFFCLGPYSVCFCPAVLS